MEGQESQKAQSLESKANAEERARVERRRQNITRFAVTVLAIAGLFTFKINGVLPESVALTFIVIAALPWLGFIVQEVSLPGGGRLVYRSAEVLQTTTDDLMRLAVAQQAAGRRLDLLIKYNIDQSERRHLENLRKVHDKEQAEWTIHLVGPSDRHLFFGDFRQQISRLINRGLIHYETKTPDLFDSSDETKRVVSSQCAITPDGLAHLALLHDIEASAQPRLGPAPS